MTPVEPTEGDGPQPAPDEEEDRRSREPGKDFELDPAGERQRHSSEDED